ncbi:MAG: hypothetical protein R3C54_01215 [Parvularculaceae bacterium]
MKIDEQRGAVVEVDIDEAAHGVFLALAEGVAGAREALLPAVRRRLHGLGRKAHLHIVRDRPG